MDGKHLPLSEFKPGITASPFHCWCRSTTVPYFDDEFTEGEVRVARGEDEKSYHVPYNTTYPEWKKSFVDGGSKEGFKTVDKPFTSNGKNASIKLDDLQFADDYSELEEYLSPNYIIGMYDSIKALSFEDVKKTTIGFDRVIDSFPSVGSRPITLKAEILTNSYMASNDVSIKYDPRYFNGKCSNVEYTLEEIGMHEASHMVEWDLIDKFGYIDREFAWNNCVAAEKVVKAFIDTLMQQTGRKAADLIREINQNATLSYSECLADAITDYLLNGKEATPLSRQIYHNVKDLIK